MSDARSAALRLILTKRKTEKEVREALIKKGFSPEDAEEAASYYLHAGYIDHADYARRFAHDAACIKGFGPYRIERELTLRGVERENISNALHEIEFDVATLMEHRFGRGVRTEKEKTKIHQYYMRKGFAPEAIREAIGALYTDD